MAKPHMGSTHSLAPFPMDPHGSSLPIHNEVYINMDRSRKIAPDMGYTKPKSGGKPAVNPTPKSKGGSVQGSKGIK